jgi:hypothetical protein
LGCCRTKRQQTAPLPFESTELMALTALVVHSKLGGAAIPQGHLTGYPLCRLE